MHRGYIKIWRKFKEDDLWTRKRTFSLFEAWLDMITEVNHKEKDIIIGMESFKCKRSESIRSIRNWAARWRWSEFKARKFFKLLQKTGKILVMKTTHKTSHISICNYDKYQNSDRQEIAETSHRDRTGIAQGTTNNNDKNEKNEKNKDIKDNIKPLWKQDTGLGYNEYRKLESKGYEIFVANREVLLDLKALLPKIDITATLENARIYWGSEKGWKKKCSGKSKTINWHTTYYNACLNKINWILKNISGQEIEKNDNLDGFKEVFAEIESDKLREKEQNNESRN